MVKDGKVKKPIPYTYKVEEGKINKPKPNSLQIVTGLNQIFGENQPKP